MVFHRVFQRDNIDFRRVQLIDHGVHGSGFTASGRSGKQNHSGMTAHEPVIKFQILPAQTDGFLCHLSAGFVQQTHNHFFTVHGGKCGHT